MSRNENRPLSRRGTESRMSSAMESARAQQNSRPVTSSMRPPSTSGQLRAPPGTARLATGLQVPKSSITQINSADRPVTQQGLAGLRTGTAYGQRRQVLDKRYYEGLVRSKMKAISNEVQTLNTEIEAQRQQGTTAQIYETRVKEVAQELIDLQGELTDYNYVLDKMQMRADASDIMEEMREVAADNEREAARLEQLVSHNSQQERQIENIEQQLDNERNTTQRILDELSVEDFQKYESLKKRNEEILREMAMQQQQIDILKSKATSLTDRISSSQLKQEAVLLYQKLHEREDKKKQLEEEARTKATPAQERDQLLMRVREDNADIAAMERQIALISDQIRATKQEIQLVQQDLEDSQSDRHQKLKELRQREGTMESFLAGYEEAAKAESERIQVLEAKVETALQHTVNNLTFTPALPSQNEFAVLREMLDTKQGDVEKSKATSEQLKLEESKLRTTVTKVEQLEEKMNEELQSLQEKIKQIHSDMMAYKNIGGLKEEMKTRKQSLLSRKEMAINEETPHEKLKTLKDINKQLKKQLNDNDTYIQLNTLEKKLELLQEANNNLQNQLQEKQSEVDYQETRKNALDIVQCYNKLLQAASNKLNA